MPEETKDTQSSTPGDVTVRSDRKVTLVRRLPWSVLQRQVCVLGCGLALCLSRMC